MDFQELLNHADYNIAESKYTGASKKYSTELPPPKKVPKSNVQSENVRRFLEKKRQEEVAKANEARKQREKLLALRAQNSKNNKKAKIMASRTKDNDFSKIKLTDEELEAKRKREEELIKKNLADKVERMKARIEMEEKEKLMPKKRKRKSKTAESVESLDDKHEYLPSDHKEFNGNIKNCNINESRKDSIRKSRPPPPAFTDLLKIAEKKQFEPVDIPIIKKEEEKLMTKKERKLREEEIAREKRKRERLMNGESGKLPKANSAQSLSINKTSEKLENKKPVVIHVGKDVPKAEQDASKFKIPKSTMHILSNKNVSVKSNSNFNSKNISSAISPEKSAKSSLTNGHKKISKLKDESSSLTKKPENKSKELMLKKNGLKINSDQAILTKSKLDEAALKAELEKEIEKKLEKKMEEKLAAKLAQFQKNLLSKATEKLPEVPKQVKIEPEIGNNVVKKIVGKPEISVRKEEERMIAMKKQAMQLKSSKSKLPERKPFHMNPYLEPPRRLLEPQRPPRPPLKRRIESDDDDDDDDDDMRDFIDDSPSQNEENYSKYIKEIFKYDKSKYLDDDDDDVMESSFAEQMKEEVRSARLGYLEDLEEERLERLEAERKKRKKLKK